MARSVVTNVTAIEGAHRVLVLFAAHREHPHDGGDETEGAGERGKRMPPMPKTG